MKNDVRELIDELNHNTDNKIERPASKALEHLQEKIKARK